METSEPAAQHGDEHAEDTAPAPEDSGADGVPEGEEEVRHAYPARLATARQRMLRGCSLLTRLHPHLPRRYSARNAMGCCRRRSNARCS